MASRRQDNTRGPFGLITDNQGWALPESFDGELESMVMGPAQLPARGAIIGRIMGKRRRFFFIALALGMFGFFFARTATLQVVNGEYYRSIADDNRTRTRILPSHRGVIYDRNGVVLAENMASFQLLGYVNDLPTDPDQRAALEDRVAMDLDLSTEDIRSILLKAERGEEVLLAEDVPYDLALKFIANDEEYPGFRVAFSEVRHYLTTTIPTLSHVLGYTGAVTEEEYATLAEQGYRRFDAVGKSGIEAYYEKQLRGTYGVDELEVDAEGQTPRVLSSTAPQDGQNITLTIDAKLQAYIELVLAQRLQTTPTRRAAVVMMNPTNGEVLALVSTPGFDANAFTRGIDVNTYQSLLQDPDAPLFPRAYAGGYPSGSVIKPTFASIALKEGVVTPETTFFSSGGVMLGNRFFPDWRPGGHGVTNVYHAIADSVNTYFYMIGGGDASFEGLGIDRLMQGAQLFGYGEPTGIDLFGEADGFLPTKEWKEATKGEPWYVGDTYNVSIGQGDFLATPLQVTRATAVIANGGQLVTPRLTTIAPEQSVNILAGDIAQVIRDAMRQTVTNGSATSLQAVSVPVAGKTGTAQWSNTHDPHSWFTGFAPYDQPQIAITVLVEEGGKTTVAVPIAKDILSWYFDQDK